MVRINKDIHCRRCMDCGKPLKMPKKRSEKKQEYCSRCLGLNWNREK